MLELACNKLIIKLPEPPLDGERLLVMLHGGVEALVPRPPLQVWGGSRAVPKGPLQRGNHRAWEPQEWKGALWVGGAALLIAPPPHLQSEETEAGRKEGCVQSRGAAESRQGSRWELWLQPTGPWSARLTVRAQSGVSHPCSDKPVCVPPPLSSVPLPASSLHRSPTETCCPSLLLQFPRKCFPSVPFGSHPDRQAQPGRTRSCTSAIYNTLRVHGRLWRSVS